MPSTTSPDDDDNNNNNSSSGSSSSSNVNTGRDNVIGDNRSNNNMANNDTDPSPTNGSRSTGADADASVPSVADHFAQTLRDLARGEQTAAALEANLTALEGKIDDILAELERSPPGPQGGGEAGGVVDAVAAILAGLEGPSPVQVHDKDGRAGGAGGDAAVAESQEDVAAAAGRGIDEVDGDKKTGP